MKKLFLVALAAVGLASCVQNEELAVAGGDVAIAFGDSYVHNATKADPTTTTETIEGFDVWAFMDEVGGTVLADEDVTKSGGAWGYANIQYWAPNHTYYFAALSPMNSANITSKTLAAGEEAKLGLGEIAFTNVAGTEDLLYAKEKAATPATLSELTAQGMDAVEMQFQHLLSKVKFTFKNGFTTDNMSVIVKNVRMSVPKSGTIDLAVADYTKGWELGTESLTLQFGDVANTLTFTDKSASTVDTRFTIPAASTQEYTVTFDVEVKAGTVSAYAELNKTATIKGYALEMGKAYNFVAEINAASFGLQPIEFTAEVDEWDDGWNGNAANGTAIHNLDELKAALAAGGSYALVNDLAIDADETLVVAAGKNVTLDLYGHTITAESDQTGSNRNLFDVRGTLTIISTSNALSRTSTDGDIVYEHKGTNMVWSNSTNLFNVTAGGVLNLSGITAKNLGGSDMAFVAHLNNWGEVTLNVDNCVLESTYIPVRVFNSGHDMNNVTIKNTALKGKYCFWVQNYTEADFSDLTQYPNGAAPQHALLNLDIYNTKGADSNNNTFEFTNDKKAPVLYGFTDAVYFDQYGVEIVELKPVKDANDNILEGIGTDPEGNYVVTADEGLTSLGTLVAEGETFAGKTVKLSTDIDLLQLDANSEPVCFVPIGSYRGGQAFSGTFDGQNHTIKNLNQNTWALDCGYYYTNLGMGLFSLVENATIKDLKIDNANLSGESAICGVVAGCAYGDMTFENITVTNSKCADYQYYSGGIVGWASGNHTYKNCNIDASTTIAAQWGDFDNSTGGVIGGAGGSAKILLEDCTVACRIDAYNDVTSTYQWYAYRRCGMLIGNTGKTKTVGNTTYADAPQLTCKNVKVIYGDWMNYTYCEFAGTSWPYVRVQAGVSNSAYSNPRYGHPTDANGNTVVDDNHVHNDGEDHHIVCAFNQLYGGGQGVYGTPTHEGVTVTYPASFNPNN